MQTSEGYRERLLTEGTVVSKAESKIWRLKKCYWYHQGKTSLKTDVMALGLQKLVNWSLPFWLHCLQVHEPMTDSQKAS